jgi:O-methyltransferase involved in polyketide biosynthesis
MPETTNQPPPGISRRSIYTAAGRAIGARESDPSVRNPDYLAEQLLGDPSAFNVTHSSVTALGLSYDEAMKDVEVVSTVRMVLVRTRFIDEALERAIASGASHVVILGAGFDSHSSRRRSFLSGCAASARYASARTPNSQRPTPNHSQLPNPNSR